MMSSHEPASARDEALETFIKTDPTIQGFLQEHARREALPREVCPYCQFEYSQEDHHVCR